MLKRTTLVIALFFCGFLASAQSPTVKWKFKTQDKVLAPPVISEQTLYIGSEDGNFYALNTKTGSEKWHFNTRDRIMGKATIHQNSVIFESGNIFYALDKETGKEIWKYDPGSALWAYKIDPWDDKRSSGTVHEGIFYSGTSLGGVIGLDVKTGERKVMIPSEYGQPVRTTPSILGSKLFFGDWAGKVYAYSLEQEKLLWKKETYEKKLYESFGGIVSEILPYKGRLYFGARNHNLQVMEDISGNMVWTYADSTGGWIVGDPVIEDNTLYIGGSDNLSMFAFNPENGALKWKFKAGQNIYTKPVIIGLYLIFTSGNGYKVKDPGNLFIVDKKNGELVSKLELPMGSFSSPATDGSNIYFGNYDGYVYAIELK